ncbi:hypothetical protein BD779DRAFT_1672732 [Infundibulicybe gibba]|nr:hypothetical protein BD779DRAFT_1672732 [Infundibulicybe gibba]
MIAFRAALVAFLCATIAIAGTVPGSGAQPKPTYGSGDGPGLGETCNTIVATVKCRDNLLCCAPPGAADFATCVKKCDGTVLNA